MKSYKLVVGITGVGLLDLQRVKKLELASQNAQLAFENLMASWNHQGQKFPLCSG